jgi:hypothetical protein
MKELNFTENIIFLFGAVLMVAGSAANIFVQPWAPYTFAAGALAFAAMQMKQRYEGKSFVIRRLRRIVIVSDVFFLLSALLMFANQANFFGLDFLLYIKYVHNNWVITLLVAAILQLYATHRISNELEKEAKKL